jgi:hypothetical protein
VIHKKTTGICCLSFAFFNIVVGFFQLPDDFWFDCRFRGIDILIDLLFNAVKPADNIGEEGFNFFILCKTSGRLTDSVGFFSAVAICCGSYAMPFLLRDLDCPDALEVIVMR